MKRILALVLVGMVVSFVFSACKSSKGGHCDAYGSIDQVNKTDVAAK